MSDIAIFTLKPTKEGGYAKVSLSYLVMGARWSPAYALHLDKKKNEARLEVRAAIAQSTGEDWTGVRVALSSAAFARPCDLPELSSLRIGRAQPPPKRAYRPPPGDVGTLFTDFERALAVNPNLESTRQTIEMLRTLLIQRRKDTI